ncbi:MAG: hypothetical protein ACW963_00300 [Candidatus Sifarchaeia archaeon]|jgi:hypothetical protein
MKLSKNKKVSVKLSQKNWEDYGKAQGWIVEAQESPEEISPEVDPEPQNDVAEKEFKAPDSYTEYFKGVAMEKVQERKPLFATENAAIAWLCNVIESKYPDHGEVFFTELYELMNDRKIKEVFKGMWDTAQNALVQAGYDAIPSDGQTDLIKNRPDNYIDFFLQAGAKELSSDNFKEAIHLFKYADYHRAVEQYPESADYKMFSREWAKYEDGYQLNGIWSAAQLELMPRYSKMPIDDY